MSYELLNGILNDAILYILCPLSRYHPLVPDLLLRIVSTPTFPFVTRYERHMPLCYLGCNLGGVTDFDID